MPNAQRRRKGEAARQNSTQRIEAVANCIHPQADRRHQVWYDPKQAFRRIDHIYEFWETHRNDQPGHCTCDKEESHSHDLNGYQSRSARHCDRSILFDQASPAHATANLTQHTHMPNTVSDAAPPHLSHLSTGPLSIGPLSFGPLSIVLPLFRFTSTRCNDKDAISSALQT